jgi:hypothetical protein
VRIERRPVHRLVAGAADPGGVPAAVTEAGSMAYKNFARAEAVTVRASRRRVGDPLPGGGPYELAEHAQKHMARPAKPVSVDTSSGYKNEIGGDSECHTTRSCNKGLHDEDQSEENAGRSHDRWHAGLHRPRPGRGHRERLFTFTQQHPVDIVATRARPRPRALVLVVVLVVTATTVVGFADSPR